MIFLFLQRQNLYRCDIPRTGTPYSAVEKRFEIGYFPETFYPDDNSVIFANHHCNHNRTRKTLY